MKSRNRHSFLSINLIALLGHLLSIVPNSSSQSSSSSERRVVCYYTNWSAYRQGPAKFLPENINPYLCTHLIYAFGGLGPEGIKPFDKYQDIDKGGYTKFNGLKTYNKALKTLLAIGGWNEGSSRFSKLVANRDSRKTWIRNSIKFLRQNNFDGLDLDWEYPGARDGGVPEDKDNYADFIRELRTAFDEEAKGSGRNRLLLTIAVPAGLEWIQKGFDIESINRDVDFINLLTYDYHASTEPAANHHAPLKASGDAAFSEYDYKSQLNIDYTIDYYLNNGASSSKLVVGLPTYGRSYTLFNSESYGVGAPASGPGTKGKYTKEPGYLAYYEICEGVKSGDWAVENDDSEAQGPHAVNGDQWVGYDDIRMISLKSKWVKDNRLGGIMFWSIDNDDFRGSCHEKPFPLIEAGKTAYLTGEFKDAQRKTQSSSTKSNSRFSMTSRRSTTTSTPRPRTTTTKKSRRKRPKKPKTTTTSTTPRTPSTTIDPFNTPAPPTTPETGVAFECTDDGFFPHPRDCKKYFWCLDAPGLGLVAHHFTCPSGLFFNKNTDSCDYARNVPCKPGGSAPTTTTPTPTTTTKVTTTTAAVEEEEYEYYDDEEEEEAQGPKHDASGKSAKEVNDIRDLLSIIKKLGGVEELEKYLAENPSVAEELEYEDEEEEEPSSTTSTTSKPPNSIPNRFTPKLKFTSPKAYSPLQRNRNVKTSSPATTTSASTEESKENKSIFRPKYVTLARDNSNSRRKATVGPSSTETSIVVRLSDADKLLEDGEEDDADESPVTIVTSRPYAQVTGSDTKSKYVTFARNRQSTTTPAPEVEEDEYLETEEEEIESPAPITTTLKPKVRIPFRKTSAFTHRFSSTTIPTTTPAPTTRRGTRPTPQTVAQSSPVQNVNYRKNFLSERRRVNQQQQAQPVAEESRRESTSTSQLVESTTGTAQNRRRFRPTTVANVIHTTALPPLPGSFQSAVIRRRTRKPTRAPTTTPSTTTTPKPKTRGQIKANQLVKIPDSNDYYYYYYDDEDEQLDKSQSQSIASASSNSQQQQQLSRRSLNLLESSDSKIAEKIINSTSVNSSTKPLSTKIHVYPNGSLECLDTGVFPHPSSCSKYVHCLPNENGIGLRGWTYSCPTGLSFDTIGGMCNWSDESPCS